MPSLGLKIGIDLDNTIIDYDQAFLAASHERKLLPNAFSGNKQQVRDHIRTLPDGETKWQQLQGYVYGQGIHHARLFPGVKEFFDATKNHQLFIISHKTEYGHFDETKINLREAALTFLKTHSIAADVSFHATRAEKVNRIAALNLDWFIDDLVEVYEEHNFPPQLKKILFHPSSLPAPAGDWRACRTWQDIVKTMLS